MTGAALLVRLYPPAVRERWGDEIRRAVSDAGIRSWPDTLAGAVRLWLRPNDWPETSPGQTRRVLALALFTVTAATALLVRATGPAPALAVDASRPASCCWPVLVLLGIGIGMPVPPTCWRTWRDLAQAAIATLAAPACAVLSLVLLARSGLVDQATGAANAALVAYYWATLTLATVGLRSLAARFARLATLPSRDRLSTAFLVTGTGLALAAAQSLIGRWPTPGADSVALDLILGLLAAATLHTGRKLLIHETQAPRAGSRLSGGGRGRVRR